MSAPPTVAVINTSPDTVDILKDALERAGFVVVFSYTWKIASGELDLEGFVRALQPVVLVYDIAPPYEKNWAILQHLRETVLKECRFVLTTPNAAQVGRLVGRDAHVYEVVGKEDDLGPIVQAVREAAKARPTR